MQLQIRTVLLPQQIQVLVSLDIPGFYRSPERTNQTRGLEIPFLFYSATDSPRRGGWLRSITTMLKAFNSHSSWIKKKKIAKFFLCQQTITNIIQHKQKKQKNVWEYNQYLIISPFSVITPDLIRTLFFYLTFLFTMFLGCQKLSAWIYFVVL